MTVVVTDLGLLEPDPGTGELTLTHVHPGVDVERARAATGWELRVAGELRETNAADGRRARAHCAR